MTDFLKYFEKAFSGLKPFLAAVISVIGYILFPEKIYLTAVMAVSVAAFFDIITKWWAICRLHGGYYNAVKACELRSRSLWDGTRVKIFSYLVVMILTGLSYRVVFLEAAGIAIASFVYTVLFFRECQSNLENLISGGSNLKWLLVFFKQKEAEVVRINTNSSKEEPLERKDYDGRI